MIYLLGGLLMSQVSVECPRCGESFEEEQVKAYECPKCGTSILNEQDTSDQEKTQIFKV
jgi:DNA-directed RNA polymerase subunit RPC12/RpoP